MGLSSFFQLLLPPKSVKLREIARNFKHSSSSRSYKVTELGDNEKRTCNVLLVININYGHISYRFRDIDAQSLQMVCFPTPFSFDAPALGNRMKLSPQKLGEWGLSYDENCIILY